MAITRSQEDKQAWLVDTMKELGFRLDTDGLCHGFSYAALTSIFEIDWKAFKIWYEAHRWLNNEFADALPSLITKTFNKYTLMVQKADKEAREEIISAYDAHYESIDNLTVSNPAIENKYNKKKQELLKSFVQGLSDEEQLILAIDILPYYNLIYVFQQSHMLPHLFDIAPKTQSNDLAFSLFQSRSLKNKGGISQILLEGGSKGVACFDMDEMDIYFSTLKRFIDATKLKIVILLSVLSHTVMVTYDHKKKIFIFADIETGIFESDNAEQFSKEVHNNTVNDTYGSFIFDYYCYTKDLSQATMLIDELHQNKEISPIIKLTHEKINYVDNEGGFILYMATMANNISTCNQIIKHLRKHSRESQENLDINYSTPSGWTSLHIAAYQGNTPLVNLLLENKADINAQTNAGHTPLMIAIFKNHTETALQLLTYNSIRPSINLTDANGNFPLLLAVQTNNLVIVKALLKSNANINLTVKRDRTFLLNFAQKHNCLDEMNRFITNEIGTNHKIKYIVFSASDLANIMGLQEIKKTLEEFGSKKSMTKR